MSEILKFKAGKVDFDEDTLVCKPSPIKGEIVIKPAEDAETFYDFVWQSRDTTLGAKQSDDNENDLLIIPGDVTWKHVKSCKTGRVFCLDFACGPKSFYWMQDKNDNEDDPSELSKRDKEIAEKMQSLIAEEEVVADEDAEIETEGATKDAEDKS